MANSIQIVAASTPKYDKTEAVRAFGTFLTELNVFLITMSEIFEDEVLANQCNYVKTPDLLQDEGGRNRIISAWNTVVKEHIADIYKHYLHLNAQIAKGEGAQVLPVQRPAFVNAISASDNAILRRILNLDVWYPRLDVETFQVILESILNLSNIAQTFVNNYDAHAVRKLDVAQFM